MSSRSLDPMSLVRNVGREASIIHPRPTPHQSVIAHVMIVAADASALTIPAATRIPTIDASVRPMPLGRNVKAPAIVDTAYTEIAARSPRSVNPRAPMQSANHTPSSPTRPPMLVLTTAWCATSASRGSCQSSPTQKRNVVWRAADAQGRAMRIRGTAGNSLLLHRPTMTPIAASNTPMRSRR